MKDCDEHVFLLFRLLLLKSCWLRLAIFGHLGDMFASFEARNLKRASRSHAKTGLCSALARAVLGASWARGGPSWFPVGPPKQ